MQSNKSYQVVSFTNLALRNGLLLLFTLFLFRLEKIWMIQLDLGVQEWALALLPEVGTVFLFEAVLVIALAFLPKSWGDWLGRTVFLVTHALLYVIAVVEHQFLIKTGTQIDISLITYTTQHAHELFSVVRSGLDIGLLTKIIIALSCFWLGFVAKTRPLISAKAVPAILVSTICIAPFLIFLSQPPGGTGTPFSTRIFADFFFPIFKHRVAQAHTIASPQPIYETPYLLNTETIRRPNVLLLILESTRADVVPPYNRGETNLHTPFFSKLAREGIVFEQVYTSVPHTSKALTGILCGMYPQLIQPIVESEDTPLPLRCLPHLLKELGYRTTFFQSAKGEFENRSGLLKNVGFDSWQLQEDLTGDYQKVGYFGMDESAMIAPAVEWIQHDRSQPFFATLLTVSTHHPYQSPGMAKWPDPGEEFSSYHKAVQHQDRFAENLYQHLTRHGLLSNTLFIVVGDHGEAFGEHYRKQHDVVPYEEGIRVPLIFYGPDWLGPARQITGLRHHIDILPSLMELIGAPLQGTLPGKSLFTSKGHEFVVSSCWYTDYCLALRHGDWKFIYHYGRMTPEVFNLSEDPQETTNRIHNVPPDLEKTAWSHMLGLKASVDHYYNNVGHD